MSRSRPIISSFHDQLATVISISPKSPPWKRPRDPARRTRPSPGPGRRRTSWPLLSDAQSWHEENRDVLLDLRSVEILPDRDLDEELEVERRAGLGISL
jgi:hypothetical protein